MITSRVSPAEEFTVEGCVASRNKASWFLGTMDRMKPLKLLNEAVRQGLLERGELERRWEQAQMQSGGDITFPAFVAQMKDVIREMLEDIMNGEAKDGTEAHALNLQNTASCKLECLRTICNERNQVADALNA